MTVIKSAIFILLERFPDRKDAIKNLFSTHMDFQTLCEDFRQCSEALKYWNQSMKTEAPARRQEYAALQCELENEIKQFLDEMALKTIQ